MLFVFDRNGERLEKVIKLKGNVHSIHSGQSSMVSTFRREDEEIPEEIDVDVTM